MNAIQDIKDIFSIFHDGEIVAWEGDKSLLTLTVECYYLARRINEAFENFFVELRIVDTLELEPWPDPVDLSLPVKTRFDDIFKANLCIDYANEKDGKVIVSCRQVDSAFDYCGGYLTIRCGSIQVFDQNKNALTIEALDQICNAYWNKASGRT